MASDGGTVVIDVQARFRNNMSPGIDNADKKVDKFEAGIDKTIQQLRKLSNTHGILKVDDKASSAIAKTMRNIREFSGKTFKSTLRVIDYATKPLRAVKDMLFSIKGLATMVLGGVAMNKVIANPIALADAYSSAKIGFSTLLGEQAGQKMMDDLDEFARVTPFKTAEVIAQSQRMLAMGWNVDDIITDMGTIGDAAAAMGKGDAGLQSIVTALAQIKSKGRLSTEELTTNNVYWLGSHEYSCEEAHGKIA